MSGANQVWAEIFQRTCHKRFGTHTLSLFIMHRPKWNLIFKMILILIETFFKKAPEGGVTARFWPDRSTLFVINFGKVELPLKEVSESHVHSLNSDAYRKHSLNSDANFLNIQSFLFAAVITVVYRCNCCDI